MKRSFARLGADVQPIRRPTDLLRGACPPPCAGVALTSLLELTDRIAGLHGEARSRTDRLFDVRRSVGITDPPTELEPWLARTFGSVDAVRRQPLVKVTNLATLESTLFAPLRNRRPADVGDVGTNLAGTLADTEADPFCTPEVSTPAGPIGRVRGRRMVTGANAALADAHHAVLVFELHDPLAFDADLVADLLDTGRRWAEASHAADPAARHYLLVWNCLWRAGGSIVHGHAQALLGAGPPYARQARFTRDAERYRQKHASDLLDDLIAVHRDLGLARSEGRATICAHLTPLKERELVVVGTAGGDERDPDFCRAVARGLLALRDRLGVRSFNLGLWRDPLGAEGGAPPVARIVDRGDLAARPSDIGAMELYGTPIVGSDPYDVIAALD